jgi:hypothetical protein
VLRPSNPKSKIENPKYEIGFEIAGYDPSRPLIIDPTLIYSSYLGGSDTDGARFVAVDGSGNAYLIGDTTSTDFPTTPSSVQADPGGPRDVFVTMIDDAGSARVYSTYLGGGGDDTVNDYGGGIAVDSDGNAYVTGRTNSTNFPITVGAIGPFQPILGGGSDAFVTKLDPNGSALVYSTYLGGSSDDFGGGIAIDDVSRFAYVTGQTQSSNFPLQGSLQPFRGSSDAFVASLNATGSALNYSTYLGGSAGDFGFGIALDGSGNAYVTGRTLSSDFPTPNAFQATAGGSGDAFVTKVAAGGTSLLYSSYLGGSDTDGGVGIAVDTPGNAYVAGWTYSSNFPKVNPLQGALAGDRDAFIAKVNPAGSALVYSTFVGGTADDVGYSIAVDSFRNAYVTGYTSSTNFPTASPLYGTNAGGLDAFVAKVNSAGSALIFSTYLGGSGDDSGAGIAVDSSGAYVTGTTASINFPTTIGAYDTGCGTDVPPTCNAGKNDAFVAKLTGLALPVVTLSPASLDFGNLAVGSTSAPRTVTLANDGDEALTLTGLAVQLSLTDPTPSPDFVESDKCGASLAAGASCTLSVLFAPTAAGIRTAVVVIDDNAAGSPHGVDLTGDGVAVSAVDLSTRFLSFGDQLVGTTSAPQAVRLTNTGSAALRISSINASGDFAQTSRCGTSLAASASCDISVTFTPGSPGLIDGFLTITDDAPGSPHEVSLSGTGIVGPVVRLSPTSLTFANQFVGTTSAAQTLTLTNGGTATLNITSIVASGDFAQTNTCGSSVAAGANCTISVTFTPTVAGSRTGAVTITDNATGSPHVVSLSGTGIVGPGVGLSPRSVNFPGNPLNIDCPSKAVTLTNTGDAPLAITSIVASANFSETNTCGTSLAGGASCVISVKFHPTVVGVTAGTLTITTNAADSPHTVALTGNGTPACRLLTSVRSATVLRGTDSTSFGVSDASPSCSPVPIELSCRLENPAACALQPATIPPSGNSTLKVSNLRAVAAELVTVVVEAVSEFRRTSESLTVLISDFAFARAPERATVRAGEATSYALAIRPVNGLEGTVRLSCSGAPQGARCTVTPSAVELDGSRLGQATVRVETTARALVGPGGEWQPPVPSLPRGLPLLLGLMSLAVLATLRRRVWLGLSVSLLLVLVWAACGGGGGSLVSTSPGSGTPAGTYTLMITGSYTAPSTGAELTHDTTVDLTVN